MKKRTVVKLLVCSYAGVALLWLAWCAVCLVYDGTTSTGNLRLDAAQLVDLEEEYAILDGGGTGQGLRTTSDDAQVVFHRISNMGGKEAPLRLVRVAAEFADNPGEMDLYYTRGFGDDFTIRRRVNGYLQEDGSYLYQLPPGKVAGLRVDMGTADGNLVTGLVITLNPEIHTSGVRYFLPGFDNLVAWVVLGALAACGIYTIMELMAHLRKKRAPENGEEDDG